MIFSPTIIFNAVAGSSNGSMVVQPVLEDKTTPPITGIKEKTVLLRHVRNL